MGTSTTARVSVLIAALLVVTAGCAQIRPGAERSSESAPGPSADGVRAAPQAGVAGAPAVPPRAAAVAPQQAAQAQAPINVDQRLIVRTANLGLLVDEVPEAAGEVRKLAESLGGFVVSSAQREENGRPAATVQIRVPADRFDSAMDRLKGIAVRVNNEQVNARDVTEEFVDTDARLRNLRATEERYLALLQQARTVDDILKIEQQLSNIRGQIEQLQGRLQFLQRSAETSLISVELRPYAAAQAPVGDWSPLPAVRNAWAALLNTVQLLLASLIWLVIFAPLWIPLVLLARFWWRQRAVRRAARAAASAPAGAAPA